MTAVVGPLADDRVGGAEGGGGAWKIHGRALLALGQVAHAAPQGEVEGRLVEESGLDTAKEAGLFQCMQTYFGQ